MQQGRSWRRGRAFTLIEVLVVIGIIMILLGILLPAMEHVRHNAYIADCASNLRQIGQGLSIYCNENHGNMPRTRYLPGAAIAEGTGTAAPDPFAPSGPAPNDITAAAYLLMRAERLPPQIMLCPYNDVNEFTPDRADPMLHANFTDYKKNLGYSFADPYPDAAAVAAGYHLTGKTNPGFALAGDRNPGINPNGREDARAAQAGAPWSQMKKANSENHEKDGQNVLFADGHVDWFKTALCGLRDDNIYVNKNNQLQASPADRDDSVLLPADE
jgi:prepilin-type processing-associated H-X9-DG protein